MSSEYTKPMVGASACNYQTLCSYNTGGQMAPMPANAKVVSGKYIVPAYNAIGYNALNHNMAGSCSGYFNIRGAYPGGGKCNQAYVTSLCGGCNKQ